MNKAALKNLRREWIITSTRRLSYQKMRLYHHGLHVGYKNIFGRGQHYYLTRIKKANAWSYIERQETKEQAEYLKKKLNDIKYVSDRLKQLGIKLGRDFKKSVEEIKKFPQDWEKKNNSILIKALKKYYGIDNGVSGYHWILFNDFESILTESAEKIMIGRGIAKNKIKTAFSILSQPTIITPLDMERVSLLEVALEKDNEKRKAILDHQKEFSFLPMYDVDYDGYSIEHFEKELDKINKKLSRVEIRKEIENIQNKYLYRKDKRVKLDQKYKTMPEVFAILDFYGTFADYKDRKPYVRDQISYYVRKLFQEIAKRLNLSLTEALFLTEAELEDALKKNIFFSSSVAGTRIEDSAFILTDGRVIIFTEKSDLEIIDRILENKDNPKKFLGLAVSPGKVKGIAAIVISNADFTKFQEGQILVASATRPDYVPIMKKAKAVITDEGGLLSHAAIASRELGVPCVVGTKVATKVLHDGDFVEVDADKGIVKVIRRK